MVWAAVGCLAACLAVALIAPRVGRMLEPALATRLLGTVSVVAAGSLFWVAGIDAGTSLAQIPLVARLGAWSPQVLESADPVPRWIAAGCLIVAVAGIVAAARVVWVRAVGLVRVRRAVSTDRVLTVIDDLRGIAFATPVAGGRIGLSTGMLRGLDPAERRALLAHESAHLRYRHFWWVAAADLAAAVCPMLRPTARAVAAAAERWADEHAAAVVEDRRVVARALARAALLAASNPSPSGALPAVDGGVVGRVHAMLAPPPRRRLVPAWLLVILVALSIATAWIVGSNADTLFDQAGISVAHSSTVDQ